ncbi:MAG: mobilization protein [Acetobacteraceae bacterium]|nr:mobilization protein [Acetobacteraceae bacterium]
MTRLPLTADEVREAVRAAAPEDWRNAADQRQAEDTARRRGRGGRPRKAAEDKRTATISVRLTPDERVRLTAWAGPAGLAEYLRRAGLGRRARGRIVPELNREAWTELARALSNLNQLAHASNAGRTLGPELAPLIESVRDQVAALRLSLLGGRPEEPEKDPAAEP